HRGRSRRRRVKARRRAATLVLAAVVGVGLLGGLAAANVLPRDAQSVAADVLDTVGVSVPNPDVHAFTNPPAVNSGPAAPGLVSNEAQSTPADGHGKGPFASSDAGTGNGNGHAYGRDNGTNATTNADANANGKGRAYGRDKTTATSSNDADATGNAGDSTG